MFRCLALEYTPTVGTNQVIGTSTPTELNDRKYVAAFAGVPGLRQSGGHELGTRAMVQMPDY